MSHIFLSYSRRDLDAAQKIIDALAGNKLDAWIDWKSIPKGEDWEREICWIWSVAFSPDGKTLASGGGNITITLWDVETHKPTVSP